MTGSAHVTILLAMRNGGDELAPQLDSYLTQTLKPARILASDDGSHDDSRAVFERFAQRARADGIDCQLFDGPQKGATANFLSLLARPGADTTHVALSDQDDIWLPGKLEDAVQRLAPQGAHPALLGTRSWEWDPDTDRRQLSRPVPPPYDFRHALVQNFAGGNTMMLNRSGLDLVQRALPRTRDAAVHDWWLYQLISGAGGTVLLGEEPHILYRQHHGNQIGANTGLRSKLRRFRAMLCGTYRTWNDLNVTALNATRDLLMPDAQDILFRFARDRGRALPARLAMLRSTRLRRKGGLNQATLWVAAVLGKL
ncbi:glycosyltransferase (plasmid) [Rhodobacteraceae bacterium M382]|nr:glycosyltransferase [Rhodobacteraceae bacterium M382]